MIGRTCLTVAVAAILVSGAAASSSASPSAASVVTQLRAAGLPVGKIRVYTAANDPNHLLGRPGQYVSKAGFHDKRLRFDRGFEVDGGGDVEVFLSRADAKRRYDYILPFSKQALFAQYLFLEGRVLLRVSHLLTPVQAKRYERVLRARF